MAPPVVTLITSRFREERPDFLLLQDFERACLRNSDWQSAPGPVLFRPTKVSTRAYTMLHDAVRPFGQLVNTHRCVLSLGLPYRHYFFGKTFPFFSFRSALRVLWTYDAWDSRFDDILRIVREAHVDLLLISSLQGTNELRTRVPSTCEVHWVPEAIEASDYENRPWASRSIDVLAFGRSHPTHHEALKSGCEARGLRYVSDRFPSAAEFVTALGSAKVSICFPRSMTHPEIAGGTSTVTLRYLQSMAAKSLIVGASPADAVQMFGYDPVVAVDWQDPVGQLAKIVRESGPYEELIERNYATVTAHHQAEQFVGRVNALVAARLQNQRQ